MVSCVFGLLFLLDAAQGNWVQQEPDVQPWNPEHSMWLLEEGGVPADHLVRFTVALKVEEDRRAMLEKIFWEVSDPKHEKYGQHITIDDITKLLNVSAQRVDAVVAYFDVPGISVNRNNDMIYVELPAAAAEKLLNTKLGFFIHTEATRPGMLSGRRIVRASTAYYLPDEIDVHVELVGELLQFPRLRLRELKDLQTGAGSWPNACNASACKGFVTPDVLAERYRFPKPSNSPRRGVVSGNKMAVAAFEDQYFKQPDLKKFSQSCRRDVTVDRVQLPNRLYPQNQGGTEANLDIEYIKAVAPEVPLTLWFSDDYSLLNWANQVNIDSYRLSTPLVHSVSYGTDEIQQNSRQYMLTCNTAFMKAGARGISLLFASGDQGVCGRSGCGKGKGKHEVRFESDFPASSPFVTAVGGTDFAGSSIGDETAWSHGGGGFSDNFDIPDFQKAAVATYKASADADLPPQNLWNHTGRGYPDIAALGGQKAPYCITTNGQFTGVAGTSAACPVTAGIFALLNGLRLSTSPPSPPLGFLNTLLYQNPSAFEDVTSGINDGDGKFGFKAVKGWDAATGLGTPNYEALSKVVMENIALDKIILA